MDLVIRSVVERRAGALRGEARFAVEKSGHPAVQVPDARSRLLDRQAVRLWMRPREKAEPVPGERNTVRRAISGVSADDLTLAATTPRVDGDFAGLGREEQTTPAVTGVDEGTIV